MILRGIFKGLRKKNPRFELLIRLARWIYPEYRLTWPYLDWWSDPWFNEYLDRFSERQGMNIYRRWKMYPLTRLVTSVPGDTVQCGAFIGVEPHS